MLAFLVRRLGQSMIVMVVAALVSFALFRFVGDPIASMAGQEARLTDIEQVRERLGLNDPFYIQFGRFILGVSQGEFGISYRLQQPVSEVIASRLPATIELALSSATIALFLGLTLGVFTALKPDSTVARFIMAASLVGVSLPGFLIGIALIYVLAVKLQWFPSFGRGEVVDLGWWNTGLLTGSGLRSLVLPSITLALFQMTLIMRLVRAEMLEILRTDYIRFARARGLSQRAINFGHALKNTLVPVVTIVGLQLGYVVAFAIVTETVFQWPGVGSLFIRSVQVADVPVMAAYLLFVAALFVLINLVVDILYTAIDPRLRVDATSAGRRS